MALATLPGLKSTVWKKYSIYTQKAQSEQFREHLFNDDTNFFHLEKKLSVKFRLENDFGTDRVFY